MPVDFVNLPDRAEIQLRPPRMIVWTMIFIAFIACAVVLTLALWPNGVATQDWKFWVWMFAVPSLLYAIVLAVRLHFFHEMPAVRTQARNDERQVVIDHNTAFAQRPLALLASAYITPMGDKDIALRIASGEQCIEAEAVRDTQEVLRHTKLPASPFDSKGDLLVSLFRRLLARLEVPIEAIPARAKIAVWLHVADEQAAGEAESAWARASARFEGRLLSATRVHAGKGLMVLDDWLDQLLVQGCPQYALIVAVQLRDLVLESTGEAAVALLLKDGPARPDKTDLLPISVHRPVVTAACPDWTVLSTAIQWGACMPEYIQVVWHSGLGKAGRDQIAGELSPQASDVSRAQGATGVLTGSDVDSALGHTGIASGWLGVALAAEHASRTGQANS
ncbi:hypothetical protein ACU4GI_39805 [Cupriavidus basilensis]